MLAITITLHAHRQYSTNAYLFLGAGLGCRKSKVRVSWQCRAVKRFVLMRFKYRGDGGGGFPHLRQVSLSLFRTSTAR
jgi:hypothetical protein